MPKKSISIIFLVKCVHGDVLFHVCELSKISSTGRQLLPSNDSIFHNEVKDVREPSTVDATLFSWGHPYNACAHWPCRYDSEKCTKGDADDDYLDVYVENGSEFGEDSY